MATHIHIHTAKKATRDAERFYKGYYIEIPPKDSGQPYKITQDWKPWGTAATFAEAKAKIDAEVKKLETSGINGIKVGSRVQFLKEKNGDGTPMTGKVNRLSSKGLASVDVDTGPGKGRFSTNAFVTELKPI